MDRYCSLSSNGYIYIPKITANQPMNPAYFYTNTAINFAKCSYLCVYWLNSHAYRLNPYFEVSFKNGAHTKVIRATSDYVESGALGTLKIPLDALKNDTNFSSMKADYHKIETWDSTGESHGETTYRIYEKKVYRIWME